MEHDVPWLQHDPVGRFLAALPVFIALLVEQAIGDAVDTDREKLDPNVAKLRLHACNKVGVYLLKEVKGFITCNLSSLYVESSESGVAPNVVSIGIELMDDGQPFLLCLPVVPR